jgi:4-hydroxythreonine-4-phosphate dehydrogenase
MVTAPLQKARSTTPAWPFPATPNTWRKTGTPQVVMMLAGEPGHGEPTLRVALATTHLPLKDVSAAITRTAWPHARHHQPICNGNSASPRRASW